MIKVGNKGIADILVGNRAVAAIYRGATLVWQKIQKLLNFDNEQKYICIEYTPNYDTTITSISVFNNEENSYTGAVDRVWILNECGLCVAMGTEQSGKTQTTIYELNGWLKTKSSMGSPKLLGGQKYFICFKGSQWNSPLTFAYYQGQQGNYKIFNVDGNLTVYTTYDLQSIPAVGSINLLSDFYNSKVENNRIFTWAAPALTQGIFSINGIENPYPFISKRDMTKVKFIVNDNDLNNIGNSNQTKLYAYIYYIIGKNPGAEIIFDTSYWNIGFNINTGNGTTTNVMNNNKGKFFKIYNDITENQITSMTPITENPYNGPGTVPWYSIYYKAPNCTWNQPDGVSDAAITDEAVLIWRGKWEYATGWEFVFVEDTNYTLNNCAEKIDNSQAKDFNKITISTDKKYYLRINGNEV